MLLIDVNVLVYAFREDAPNHLAYHRWLTDSALEFAEALRAQPNCMVVAPGPRHWEIFTELCRITKAQGNFIPDAFLAAIAIEAGLEWITTDGGFKRFPDLRWRHPLSS